MIQCDTKRQHNWWTAIRLSHPTSMPTVIIDDREIEIPGGRRLNGIEAAKLAGIEIPYYCWHPGPVGGRQLPHVSGRGRLPRSEDGQDRHAAQAHAGLQHVVTDDMVLVTNSEKVAPARAMVEEGLLLRHPIDCPICDKAGECVLQDYHFQYGQDDRRADVPPVHQPPARPGRRHAVRRSLRPVQPVRALYGRNQRHQRADVHRPRGARGNRRRAPASP